MLTAPYADLKIVDVDSHFSEPHDLWTSRAPAKYRDLVPRVEVVNMGDSPSAFGRNERYWVLNDDKVMFHAGGMSFIDLAGDKEPYFDSDISRGKPWEEVHPASYDVGARLKMMDELDIWASIVYPNVMAFGISSLLEVAPELSALVVEIYNDAMAEWQAESGGRLFPQAMIPFWDMDRAVKECERIKELGLTGIILAGEPNRGGLPDLGQLYWDPLYEAVSDLDLPINIHAATSRFDGTQWNDTVWPSVPQERGWKPIASVQGELANSIFMTNILLTDVLTRWPKTQWISVESGIGWIPFVLERVDYEYFEEFKGIAAPDQPRAIDLFRKNIYGTFWFEKAGPQALLEYIGIENVMWESDFPHPTCLHPSPVERTLELLTEIPEGSVRKIMQDNAVRVYHLPIS